MARWLHTHPSLDERVGRLYGRRMQPLPVEHVRVEREGGPGLTSAAGQPAAQPGPTIASLVDPFARFM